jgi:hypothetical protein
MYNKILTKIKERMAGINQFEFMSRFYDIDIIGGHPFVNKKALFDTTGKVLNPDSGKYVKADGTIGSAIIHIPLINAYYIKSKTPRASPAPARASPAPAPVRASPAPVRAVSVHTHVPEVKIMDQRRAANLEDAQLTISNIATLSPSEVIGRHMTTGDPQELIRQILNNTGFISDLKPYRERLQALRDSGKHSVIKISDDDERPTSSRSSDSSELNNKYLEEYKILFTKDIDSELEGSEKKRFKVLASILKQNGYESALKTIQKEMLSAFGSASSKFIRAKRSKKKTTLKPKKKRTTKAKRSSKKTTFGHIYGLQDSPGYTGVFPLARGHPPRVPLDYLGNPANTVNPYLPNLNNVVRDYTNTGGDHGKNIFNFGLPPKPITPHIPNPAYKHGF